MTSSELEVGQDTHEVMAISTSMSERGIQRPKQQNTDTTYLERSEKLFAARRESLCSLSQKFYGKGSRKQNLNSWGVITSNGWLEK